ncbi:hypothetical protein [Pseudonocardia acidicola]|uniref:Uncharacterized protein n=1 Tax=Pseudonocardia acidicola TaxID=2724939 RepID=A0ABX1S9V8_9PSEU|nr:hypothetical protein [Pseudonocardia acidicola]NMH98336.1 hypothetical protein [Pseudonocardia acidicola]
MPRAVGRFDGWIAGLGTAAGLRVVVGHWPHSPFGTFTDVMLEQPDGHRVLLAPDQDVADFVAGTYRFDEVRVGDVVATVDGPHWRVSADLLDLTFRADVRPPLGRLLRLVPRPLATARWWVTGIDVVARAVLPGVRTRGSAGGGRSEFYAALDLHRVRSAAVRWEGADQGPLAPVSPPVRFGFGSTPRTPSLVRVVTLVRPG